MDFNGISIPGTSSGPSFQSPAEPPEKKKKVPSQQHNHYTRQLLDEYSDSDSDSDIEIEYCDHGNSDQSSSDYKLGPFRTIKEEKRNSECPNIFTFLSLSELSTTNLPMPPVSTESDKDPLTTSSLDCNDNPPLNTSSTHFISNENLKIKPSFNTPIDFFVLLFTHEFLQAIVDEANRFAYLPYSQIRNWKDLTVNELKVFLGLFLHTSIIKIMHIRYYWDKSELFNLPFFSSRMSKNRFMAILKCLHFTDDIINGEPTPKDPLNGVNFLIQHFHKRMKEVYEPETNINPDVPMPEWTGRIFYRTYILNKSRTHSIKLYILAENDGLVHRLLIQSDTEETEIKSQIGLRESAREMMKGIENSDHPLVMEKFENGVTLTSELLHDIDKKDNPQLARRRAAQEKSDILFNKRVGAMDQLLSCYLNTRRSLKWYMKLWFDIIELMLLNSYLLFRRFAGDKEHYLFRFRLEVIKCLTGSGLAKLVPNPAPPTPCFINSVHFPARFPECAEKRKRRMQKRCKLCFLNKKSKFVITYCPGCEGNPGLCLGCFIEYHRINEFKII